ncbi:hypothetical protein CEXT_720651 [Caerostris extrusa]|uniref:Uncharacterized protein n=1 Tax=Caerostris extrusa TaxID=172846 RepID=A0AAV4R154_CAEEX|nr:hypothetical protein CEXT_720651 [Caerostris extrusa]
MINPEVKVALSFYPEAKHELVRILKEVAMNSRLGGIVDFLSTSLTHTFGHGDASVYIPKRCHHPFWGATRKYGMLHSDSF